MKEIEKRFELYGSIELPNGAYYDTVPAINEAYEIYKRPNEDFKTKIKLLKSRIPIDRNEVKLIKRYQGSGRGMRGKIIETLLPAVGGVAKDINQYAEDVINLMIQKLQSIDPYWNNNMNAIVIADFMVNDRDTKSKLYAKILRGLYPGHLFKDDGLIRAVRSKLFGEKFDANYISKEIFEEAISIVTNRKEIGYVREEALRLMSHFGVKYKDLK